MTNTFSPEAKKALDRVLRFRSVEVTAVEGIQEDGLHWALVLAGKN